MSRLVLVLALFGLFAAAVAFRAGQPRAQEYPYLAFVPLAARDASNPTPTPTTVPCHPSYPTLCVPPPPPDIDCADIPNRSFPVLPPDPHHFDGDGDGIGCEPLV